MNKWMEVLRVHIDKNYYQRESYRQRQIKDYFSSNSTVKLHIGCGNNRYPGWLNTDISEMACKHGAVYMDAGATFPFPDDSFDYVYSEHLFEHLSYSQAVNMLRECHRVMKPSGVIRIATPNIQFLINLYQNPEDPTNKAYIKWSAEGDGRGPSLPEHAVYVINKFHKAWGHMFIYDEETLSDLMRENGFSNIHRCEISESTEPALQNVEGHFKYMPYVFYQLETMILEGKKL